MGRAVRSTRLLDQVKDDRPLLLGSPAMERLGAVSPVSLRARAGRALRRPQNWVELVKFCLVGLGGYAINLAVYTALLRGAGLHYLPAAACSFVVAVTNNYALNRLWTFRRHRGHLYYQGLRFLVALELDEVVAQAIAIIVVTPLNFVGNKLWSFRRA